MPLGLAETLFQCIEQKGYDFTGTMGSFQLFLIQEKKMKKKG